MVDYTEDEVERLYPSVTGLVTPTNTWDLYWAIANQKVRSDSFSSEDSRVLGAIYYIAYLASSASVGETGQYASVSTSIDSVSRSSSLQRGMEDRNVWLDRYNALLLTSNPTDVGGCIVKLPVPDIPYRDRATARHIRRWWG